MLKQDHDKVDKAFKDFEKMDPQDARACRQLIRTVCEDLKLHTTLEEEVFYPAVREAIDDEDLMNEAAVEHETAKMLVDQLDTWVLRPNYFATFTVRARVRQATHQGRSRARCSRRRRGPRSTSPPSASALRARRKSSQGEMEKA